MSVHHSSTGPNEYLGEITVFEKSGGSHQKVIFPNRHGRLGRVIIPRASRRPSPDRLAHELIRHPNIEPAGDALPFGNGEPMPCQTYRFFTGRRESRKETTMVAVTSKIEFGEQKETNNV